MPVYDNKKENEGGVIVLDDRLPVRLIVIPIVGKPLFPGLYAPIIIPAVHSEAIEKAIESENGFLGLNLYVDGEAKDDGSPIEREDLYRVGVIVNIFKKINLPDGSMHVLVNSIKRYKIIRFNTINPMIMVEPLYIEEIYNRKIESNVKEIKAYTRALISEVKLLSENNPLFTEEMRLTMVNVDEPGRLADFITSMLNLDREQQQSILETFDVRDRLEKVLLFVQKEKEIAKIQIKIQGSINSRVKKQQRDYFLKEQLKEIQKELGYDTDPKRKEIEKYKENLAKLDLIDEVRAKIESEVEKISLLDTNSPEYGITRNYLDYF